MVFDARDVAAKQSWEPFAFIGLDGKTYHLPNVQTLTGEQSKRFNAGDESVMAEVTDPADYEALQKLPNGVAEQLAAAWLRHGGPAGKGPSRSSPTRKPKKR